MFAVDIACGVNAGVFSLLVLTGTRVDELTPMYHLIFPPYGSVPMHRVRESTDLNLILSSHSGATSAEQWAKVRAEHAAKCLPVMPTFCFPALVDILDTSVSRL